MLAILPLTALLGLVFVLGNLWPDWGWRRCSIRALGLWWAYVILVTEGLSLVKGITPPVLAGAWSVPIGVSGALLAVEWRRAHSIRFPHLQWPKPWVDRALTVGVLMIVLATGLVAWFAPPQTWDSLNYHMSRVAHWAQNQSVAPYATGIEIQNSRPPAAEFAVLQIYVLVQGDRLSNFIEWLAMLGCLIGVTLLASQLGGGRGARLVAAVYASTIPMGIIQASSTMTDYVVALWVVLVASETVNIWQGRPCPAAVLFLGMGAGLGLNTKPTAYAFLVPFGMLAGIGILRSSKLPSALRSLAIVFVAVGLLNVGHLVRMHSVYGSVVEPKELGVHANQALTFSGVASNLLRNVGLQLGTPSGHVNKAIYLLIGAVHCALGIDLNDPRTTAHGPFKVPVPRPAEGTAANPLHAYTGLAILALLGLRPRKWGMASVYAGCIVAAFVVFCAAFKWQIFGSRYHLPLLVLLAPLVAVALEAKLPVGVTRILGLVLILGAIPALTTIESRPLIPRIGQTFPESILVAPREELLLASGTYLVRPYQEMISRIRSSRCSRVGLIIGGAGAEYPLWAYLGAPRTDLQLEWIVGGTASARFERSHFEACAVICDETCPSGWDTVRGLPKAYDRAGFRLYLAGQETGSP